MLWNIFQYLKVSYNIPDGKKKLQNEGPTEIWTRIAGFKVQSANHYTMGPCLGNLTWSKNLFPQEKCRGKQYLKLDFVNQLSLVNITHQFSRGNQSTVGQKI